jgi:hypothetical protein
MAPSSGGNATDQPRRKILTVNIDDDMTYSGMPEIRYAVSLSSYSTWETPKVVVMVSAFESLKKMATLPILDAAEPDIRGNGGHNEYMQAPPVSHMDSTKPAIHPTEKGMMFEPMDFERQWSTTSLRLVALAGLGGVG